MRIVRIVLAAALSLGAIVAVTTVATTPAQAGCVFHDMRPPC